MKVGNKIVDHKVVSFQLVNEQLHTNFGKISFNGKFVFELDSEIDPHIWNQIGIIPLKENQRRIEVSVDQFYYLNSRLPKRLRNETTDVKLEYINKTGLKVASDSFKLVPIKI